MKKVLVSALMNLGDVIMLSSALALLKQNYPQIKIDVLARQDSLSILKHNPLINKIILYPYKSGSFFYGLKDTVKTIKNNNYNLYISLDRRPRAAIACFLAGIKKRVGPSLVFGGSQKKLWTSLLYNKKVEITETESKENDYALIFQKILRQAFSYYNMPLKGIGRITLAPISSQQKHKAQNILKQAQKPIIGFCVKTQHLVKVWSADNFKFLINMLHERYKPFFYISGTKEERQYVQNLINSLNFPCLNLAGETSLPELMALADISDIYISLENGAAHLIANNTQTPLICLMHDAPNRISYSLKRAHLISASANEDGQFLIDNISPQEVYEKIKYLLTEAGTNV